MSKSLVACPASRLRRLAVSIGMVFGLSPAATFAASTTWTINSCSDATSGSGTTGTLRYALNNAASGDFVDMTGIGTGGTILSCSRISLVTGTLTANQSTLTLSGPGADKLDIDATASHSRVLDHSGAGGTLYINDVSLSAGYATAASGTVRGGCLNSGGNVNLTRTNFYNCHAYSSTSSVTVDGGAMFAIGNVSVYRSSFHDNGADAPNGSSVARGGAIYILNSRTLYSGYSTFEHNHVYGGASAAGVLGGALFLHGGTIKNTTISGNSSSRDAGGFFSSNTATGLTIVNSTISGNHVSRFFSGGYSKGPFTMISSTVAFNVSDSTISNNPEPSGLVVNILASGPYAFNMQSSLISNNTFGGVEMDFIGGGSPSTTSNNLIVAAYLNIFPSGTISGVCPHLGPLRSNGGPTKTHALLSGSAGIDQGDNPFNLTVDQRGPGFARELGPIGSPSPVADIGAYEVDQADIVFNNSFDGCP